MLAAACGAVTLFAGQASAATIKVCQGSCSYSEIQDAINDAAPGDTLDVKAGTYEPFTVDRSLTIKGVKAGVDAPSRRNRQNFETIVDGTTATVAAGGAVVIAANGVTLDGFTVKSTAVGYGVIVTAGSTDVDVLNNIIKDNVTGIYLNTGDGTPSTVKGNWFSNNDRTGPASGNDIYADQGTHDVSITENRFDGSNNSTAVITRGLGFPLAVNENITFSDNYSLRAGVVRLDEVTGLTVKRNTISRSTSHGFQLMGTITGLAFENNVVSRSTWSGLRLVGTASGVAKSNAFTDNGDAAVRITGAALGGFDLTSNNFERNGSPANYPTLDVDNSNTGQLDATGNFWGCPTGPNGSKCEKSGVTAVNAPSSRVDTAPFSPKRNKVDAD